MSQQFSRVYILDFFRGIAAFGVLIFHVLGPYYKWFQSLYVLVDFFFVLSGYVLANSMEVNSWKKVRLFIQKRIRRIFPMVLSALLFSEFLRFTALLFNNSDEAFQTLFSETRLINLLIAVTLLQVFSFPSQLLLFPLWSLSAEWIANIVGILSRRIVGQIQTHMFILCGVVLFSACTYWGLLDSQSNWAVNLGRCLMCFGAGQLIKQIGDYLSSKEIKTVHMVISAFGSFIYLALVHNFGQNVLVLAPLVFGYIVWSFSARVGLFGHGRMKTISRFAGTYSYGLYVWHIPALGVCDIALKRSNIKFSSTILLNGYQLIGTLIISIGMTFFVRKYIENSTLLKPNPQ